MANLNNSLPNPFQSLPNPFQNTTAPPIAAAAASITTQNPISVTKSAQNDTSLFHGYRSNFNINQQKEIYQQRMTERVERGDYEQANQRNKFNWNAQKQNGKQHGNGVSDIANHNNSANNWCELCECGFKYPKQLEKHQDEHEKCWFDNCNFEGHSKLLKKHVETQHQSGFFQRIGKVESEEDIMKWREERRKRYPTKENIEARRLAQEERLKRGERIQEPRNRFGNMNNRKSAQHRTYEPSNTERNQNDVKNQGRNKKNDNKRRRTRNHNKSGKGDDNRNKNKDKNDAKTEVETNAVDETECTKISPTEPVEVVQTVKTEPSINALTAIVGMYGSDSESDDVEEGEINESQLKEEDAVESITKSDETQISETTAALENNLVVSVGKRSASIEDELPSKQSKTDLDIQNMDDSKIDNSDPTVDGDKNEMNTLIEENPQSESDGEAPDEQPIQRQTNDLDQMDAESSGRTDVKPINKQIGSILTNERIVKKRTVLDMTRKIRNQNSLLEKLLQNDIRHERNVLLQCVRYVVKNQFFGIGQKTDEQNNQIANPAESTEASASLKNSEK